MKSNDKRVNEILRPKKSVNKNVHGIDSDLINDLSKKTISFAKKIKVRILGID